MLVLRKVSIQKQKQTNQHQVTVSYPFCGEFICMVLLMTIHGNLPSRGVLKVGRQVESFRQQKPLRHEPFLSS